MNLNKKTICIVNTCPIFSLLKLENGSFSLLFPSCNATVDVVFLVLIEVLMLASQSTNIIGFNDYFLQEKKGGTLILRHKLIIHTCHPSAQFHPTDKKVRRCSSPFPKIVFACDLSTISSRTTLFNLFLTYNTKTMHILCMLTFHTDTIQVFPIHH